MLIFNLLAHLSLLPEAPLGQVQALPQSLIVLLVVLVQCTDLIPLGYSNST